MVSRWLFGGIAVTTSIAALLYANAFLSVHAGASDDHVVVLTEANFKEHIESKTVSFVKFYSPTCGHCKAMAPDFKQAAEELKDEDVVIGKVDCTEHPLLCQQHRVTAYPTLRTYLQNTDVESAEEYPPPSPTQKQWRSAPVIVDYIKKVLEPAVEEKDDKEEADAFIAGALKEGLVVVVGVSDAKGFDDTLFADVAKRFRTDTSVKFVKTPAVAFEGKATTEPLAIFKAFDEKYAALASLEDVDSVVAFVKAEKVPLVEELDQDNFKRLALGETPLAQFYVEEPDVLAAHQDDLYAMAKTYRGKVNVAWVNATKYGSFGDSTGLESTYPAFGIIKFVQEEAGAEPGDLVKYPLRDVKKLDAATMEAHLAAFVKGDLEPYYKTEEEPVPNDGPVKVLTRKTLQKVAFDGDNDVLIEFYAPWCGHCKALAPTLEELGTSLKDTKIVIAKFDATANDIPPVTVNGVTKTVFDVEGFPTLYFVKGDTKEILPYQSGRRLADFKKFLKKHSTHKDAIDIEEEEEGETDEGYVSDEERDHDEL